MNKVDPMASTRMTRTGRGDGLEPTGLTEAGGVCIIVYKAT